MPASTLSGEMSDWGRFDSEFLVRDIAYSSGSGHLFVLTGADPLYPNALLVLDPATSGLITGITLAPGAETVTPSEDGSRAYVTYERGHLVVDVSLEDPEVLRTIDLGGWYLAGDRRAVDLAVQPGHPGTIAVAMVAGSNDPVGVAIFDDGVQRTNIAGLYSSAAEFIEWIDDDTIIGTRHQVSLTFMELQVTPEGANTVRFLQERTDDLPRGLHYRFTYHSGRLYLPSGLVVDYPTLEVLDSNELGDLLFPDPRNGLIYRMVSTQYSTTFRGFEAEGKRQVGSAEFPGVAYPTKVVVTGDGLAVMHPIPGKLVDRGLTLVGPGVVRASGAPTNLRSRSIDSGVFLEWDPPADADTAGVAGYLVLVIRVGELAPIQTLSTSDTSITVSGLPNGIDFRIVVRPVGPGGNGLENQIFARANPTRAERPAGYRLLEADGTVYAFGDATSLGDATPLDSSVRAVAMDSTRTSAGYSILLSDGEVLSFGDAVDSGDARDIMLDPGERWTSISVAQAGPGYWLFTNRGRVVGFGDAHQRGDLLDLDLAGEIVASVATPSGSGYYMLGADGGVFTFGDAVYHGSIPEVLPGRSLDCPVVGLVPTPTGEGYWLVACDGGVFSFGDAYFVGSLPGISVRPNRPVNGLVSFGSGYIMVAEDGGAFVFGNSPFFGSLGANPPDTPVVGISPFFLP
ncbi:MAG TPA: fibronectin type III domain-containing protein [Acidimicrobiales bacterium]|nr:fibronectin type III domain-containing protein [Acidimicrobiales bacterium]